MQDEPKVHENPPLAVLNAAARAAAEATRKEQAEIEARMGLRERSGQGDTAARQRAAAYKLGKGQP